MLSFTPTAKLETALKAVQAEVNRRGHPLSLRLLLPQLENVSAAQLLAAVPDQRDRSIAVVVEEVSKSQP